MFLFVVNFHDPNRQQGVIRGVDLPARAPERQYPMLDPLYGSPDIRGLLFVYKTVRSPLACTKKETIQRNNGVDCESS
jgi:hypothetical protein